MLAAVRAARRRNPGRPHPLPPPTRTDGAALVDPTGAIVAAAQNADLLYLQHIVIPTGPLRPHARTRRVSAAAAAGAATPARRRRRHDIAHVDLLVFAQPHSGLRTGTPTPTSTNAADDLRDDLRDDRSVGGSGPRGRRSPGDPNLDATRRRSAPGRCGRRGSTARPCSAAAGTCPSRSRTRPRCCPRWPRTPSPPTPGPGTWCWTRCAGSAPPSSKPSTWTGARSGSSTRLRWAETRPRQHRPHRPAAARARGGCSPATPATWTALLPADLLGQVALVVTSPPYGPSTHGRVTTDHTGVHKRHHLYGDLLDRGNLANIGHHRLLAGFTRILTLTAPYLRPGGRVVITVRPWREHAELIDLPAQIHACARAAGLVPVERCVALLGRVTETGGFVARGSFFQRDFIRRQRARGLPLHLIAHEDVIVLRPARFPAVRPATTTVAPAVSPPRPGPDRLIHRPRLSLWIAPRRHGPRPVTAAATTRRNRSPEPGPRRPRVGDGGGDDGRRAGGRRGDRRPMPSGRRGARGRTVGAAVRCCRCAPRPRRPGCWRCRSRGCGGG